MKRARLAAAMVLAIAVVTATPAQAANTAVGSVHSSDSEFNSAATLENVTVSGSGTAASVEYSGSSSTLFDTFEDGDVSEWEAVIDGKISADTTRVYSGTYAGYQPEPSGSGSAQSKRDLPNTYSDTVTVDFYTNVQSTSYRGFYYLQSGGSTEAVQIKIENGDWGYYDGSSYVNVGGDGSADTWHHVEIVADPSTDTFDLIVDGQTLGTDVPFKNSASDIGEFRVGAYSGTSGTNMEVWVDNLEVSRSGSDHGVYVSTNHSVEAATSGWTNLSVTNATAMVTWQGSNGGGWTDVASTTYSSGGNKTQSLSGGYSRWRVNVTFENQTTNGAPSGSLYDEGVLFRNDEPTVDNSSATPSAGTTLNTTDPSLSIDINDSTFGTQQGEELNVSFYVDGSFEANQTVTSNGTVSQQVSGLTGGSHSWYVVANDSYGGSTTSETFSFKTPDVLEIRNESQPSELVDNVEVRLEFYYTDPVTIENKSTTTGVVDFSDLPTDRGFVVVADAPGYLPRRIYVGSLLETQQVYLLNESQQSVTPTFELQDFSGDYPPEETVLKVQRGINGSWQTAEGDYFGATESISTNLRFNVRHRLVLLNTETGQRKVLGPYTPVGSTREVITITDSGNITVQRQGPDVTVDPQTRSLPASNDTTVRVNVRKRTQNISSWNATVTYRTEDTTVELARTNRTDPGTFEPVLPLANRSEGNVTVRVQYELENGTVGTKRVVYGVRANYSNTNSLLGALGGVGDRFPAQHVGVVQGFLAVIVSIMSATAVASIFRASSEVVGLVAVSTLAGFAIVGWVGYGPVFLSSTAWVAIVGVRRGL